MEEQRVTVGYPANALEWLGIPVIDTESQYDRIDDVLNNVLKKYNPDGQERMRNVFIARFIVGMNSEEIESRGICGTGEWNADKLMKKLRSDIHKNQFYMDYLRLLRNTYHDRFERVNCDVRDSRIARIPSRAVTPFKNIWGLDDTQWRIIELMYINKAPVRVIGQELGMTQYAVKKALNLALEIMRSHGL